MKVASCVISISIATSLLVCCQNKIPETKKNGNNEIRIENAKIGNDTAEQNEDSLERIKTLKILNENTVLENDMKKTIIGEYLGIEVGDYQHLKLKVKEDTVDFWGSGGLKDSSIKIGQKIQVQWKEERQFIQESGETLSLEIAEKAKIVE